MPALSWILVLALVAAFVVGLRHGALSRIARICAMVVAIFVTRLAGGAVLSAIADDGVAPTFTDWLLAYFGTFVVCYVIVLILTQALAHVVRWVIPRFVDRVCGAIFNTLEWAMVLSVALNVVLAVSPALAGDKDFGEGFTPELTAFAPAVVDCLSAQQFASQTAPEAPPADIGEEATQPTAEP